MIDRVPAALRKHLRPARALAGTAKPEPPNAVLLSTHVYRTKQRDTSSFDLFAAGLEEKPKDSFAKARHAAHALLGNLSADAVKSASIETLAIAEAMIVHFHRAQSLASLINATRGPADAVTAIIESTTLTVESFTNESSKAFALHVARTNGWAFYGDPCTHLRHLVCALSDKDYAIAKKVASELRKKATFNARFTIAYCFPDEPTWANEELATVLDALIQNKTQGKHGLGVGPANNVYQAAVLLSAASDPEIVRRWVDEMRPSALPPFAVELALRLPPHDAPPIFQAALTPLLQRPKFGPTLKTPPREVAQGLMVVNTQEAATVLAAYATHVILGPMVLAYFRDHPEHGDALQAQAKGKKLEATAERVLGKGKPTKNAAIAKTSEVPPILRDTPWRATKGSKPKEVTLDLELLGLDREKVKLVRPSNVESDDLELRPQTKEEHATWKKKVEQGVFAYADAEISYGVGSSSRMERIAIADRDGLWAWNEKEGLLGMDAVRWVEKHGTKAIPGFHFEHRDWIRLLTHDSTYHHDTLDAALSLVSPRIAPTIARIIARRKHFRAPAIEWLVTNAEVACYGLIPDLFGEHKERRADARNALLFLARQGHDTTVRKVAKAYGKPTAQAIDDLLDRDPLAINVTVPKRPEFLRLDALPQIKLKKGSALPEDAVSALIETLQISSLDDPYLGLTEIRQTCDEATLGDLAIELTEQWVIGDAPGRHEWMLHALLHFKSEKGTRRLAELAREWAQKSLGKAERACEALAADASDIALMHLAHIAETARFAALKQLAAKLVRDAAAERGLTEDELGDRTVPDSVADKKELKSVLAHQLRRLERAMASGRTWSAADFELRIAKQPILAAHVARTLVWEIVAPKQATLFRIAEDGSYANANDEAIELPQKGLIRIAHPARSKDLAKTWGSIFGDYEIIQPIEQLARAVFEIEKKEAKAKALERAADITVPATKLLGTMESRGWRRNDAEHVTCWLRSFPSGLTARWPLEGGISMESLSAHPDVKTEALVIVNDKGSMPLSTLDAVSFSEIVRDVEAVRSLR